MTNNKRLFFGLFSVFALVTLFTLHTFGQSPPLPDGINPVTATNGAPVATPAMSEQSTATELVMGFIPLLVPLLIAAKKKIFDLMSMPKFPTWLLPMLAVGLGELLNWIASLNHAGVGPGLAALLGVAGVGVRELLVQIKGKMGSGGAVASVIVGALLIGFVATGCNGRLENGGAYAPGTNAVTVDATSGITSTNFVPTQAPDYPFAQVEIAFDFAYSTIDAVFNFERDNRQMLWNISPDIKHALDKLRPQAVAIRNDYIKARVAYQAHPIPSNLSTMQSALTRIQDAAIAVQAAIPASAKPTSK